MKTRKFVFSILLLACLLSGLLLRYAGLTEPFQLHPDEQPISVWMDRMHETHSLLPKTYAGGFFVLADAAQRALEWIVAHPVHRWNYFVRATDRYSLPRPDDFAFGRNFNVWLGVLAILLVAGLTRRIAGSRAGTLTAAALMAFAAYPIEHAHYLETDVAMLATLALALLLMARALATRRRRDLACAAFAAGFAAGTKFPMAILVAPLLATALHLPLRPDARHRLAKRTADALLIVVLLAIAGFVVASPDARHVSSFVAGLRHGESSVYAETAGLLGAAAHEPHAREWMNAANMARFATSLGAGWLALAAIGFGFCFTRRFRPFWPVALLFPALHLWFIVFHAPWSRSQEFMALLPNFCLWAALPVAALWSSRRRPTAAKACALVLCACAALPALRNGIAMSSTFAWEDTRRLANRKLKTCYPEDKPLGVELYTAPAEVGVAAQAVGIGKYEAVDPSFFATNPVDYVLVNADAHGRGIQDPRTGKLFPDYAARMETLLTYGQCIAAWGPLDSPAPLPAFRSPRIELWSQPDQRLAPAEEIGVELPRPTLVRDDDRATFFCGSLRAGPRFAALIDKIPREIAVGGPGEPPESVFLVFCTRERAAAVCAKGFGRTDRLELGPYDADAIPLRRPWWNPRWVRYERIVVRSETGGPTLTYLPCFLRLAFDPLEAAAILLDEGHPQKAIALLREQDALADAGPFWRALAGDSEARTDAQDLLARWDEWLARDPTNPPAAFFGGIRLETWQDFARIRLVERPAGAVLHFSFAMGQNTERQTPALANFLPVTGARQHLEMVLGRNPDAFGNTNFSGQVELDLDDRTSVARFEFLELPDPRSPDLKWTYDSASFPRNVSLSFRAHSGGAVRVEKAEFAWNWRDMLAVRRGQLARALADHPASAARRYGDWLAVRSCRVENGQARLELEALQDFIPPLAVQLQILRRGKWRPQSLLPLPGGNSPWLAGERRSVAVPLETDFVPDQTGIALVSDVQWHSSLLPLVGAPEKRPFPTLAELLRSP